MRTSNRSVIGAYAAAYDVYDQDEDDLDTTASIYDTIFVVKKIDFDKKSSTKRKLNI